VMKRTRSPRATRCRATASSGVTWPWMAKIAAAAGVSAETVQAHGPKAALMIASVEYAAFGVIGDHNVLDLELGQRFVAITDRDEAVDVLVAEQTAVHQRSASVTQALVGAAAVDPELDGYLDKLIAGVGRQIRRVLEVSRQRGWLRDDVPFDELVETTAVISSIETYTRMVHRDGWRLDAYRAWFRRMLDEVVLRPEPGEQHPSRATARRPPTGTKAG
jgi:AcrR family transcriptional regulator